MITKILADFNGHLEAIEEQKKFWIYDVLTFLNIEVDKWEELPGDLAIKFLNSNRVNILDYPDKMAVKIEYRSEANQSFEIIGEWIVSDFFLKRDDQNKLYYEIVIESWSVIEERIAED